MGRGAEEVQRAGFVTIYRPIVAQIMFAYPTEQTTSLNIALELIIFLLFTISNYIADVTSLTELACVIMNVLISKLTFAKTPTVVNMLAGVSTCYLRTQKIVLYKYIFVTSINSRAFCYLRTLFRAMHGAMLFRSILQNILRA